MTRKVFAFIVVALLIASIIVPTVSIFLEG
jgi:hypothetical protein